MQFSELIKRYRKKNFLSQTELAKMLDVDQKTVSLMETIPDRKHIKEIRLFENKLKYFKLIVSKVLTIEINYGIIRE